MRIDAEPRPRERALRWRDPLPPLGPAHPLKRAILAPDAPFFPTLTSRASTVGVAGVPDDALASVLWHATSLRERRPAGRFGLPWESRNAPSAGGLHPLRLLVVPVGDGGVAGLYDPDAHALLTVVLDDATLRGANSASVRKLTGARAGTTLQVVADPSLTAACYEDHEILVQRDAGALAATVCLVAAALGLASVPMGRSGTPIVRFAGLGVPFVGLGAIHLST